MGVTVDFASDDFEQQVLDVVANAGGIYTSLISAQDAIEHLNLTLGNMVTTRSCATDSTKIGYTGSFSTLALRDPHEYSAIVIACNHSSEI